MKALAVNRYLIGIVLYLCLVVPTIAASTPQFDIDDLDKGILHISYNNVAKPKTKVMIEKGDKRYTYNLNTTGKKETFPLQLGNGSYKVSVLENTTADKYKLVAAKEITLSLKDPNIVYLNSIQNIEWEIDSLPVKKSQELNKNIVEKDKKTEATYQYVVNDYSYDYTKLEKLSTTYLPSINATYKEKTGICYDFSALYASMLRSQGIPVKMVKGYTPNAKGYHAWNEAYNEKKGEWVIIDATYDLQLVKMNKKFSMKKSAKDYEKINEY